MDIYQKYRIYIENIKKNQKYRIFSIFSKISWYFPSLAMFWGLLLCVWKYDFYATVLCTVCWRRQHWTATERQLLFSEFGTCISRKTLPSGKEIAQFACKLGTGRTVSQIRTEIHNYISGKIRLTDIWKVLAKLLVCVSGRFVFRIFCTQMQSDSWLLEHNVIGLVHIC